MLRYGGILKLKRMGCLQEFDWQAIEADEGVLEGAAGGQDCKNLCHTLLWAVEKRMENRPIIFLHTPLDKLTWIPYLAGERILVESGGWGW